MTTIGKIKSYNGRYGTILVKKETIDFDSKDISLGEEIKVGDIVEFRVEEKFPNIKIARNIKLIDDNISNNFN